MLGNYLDEVRKKAPLIHNITNYVTINDVANMVLPAVQVRLCQMSRLILKRSHPSVRELNINMGMLNPRKIESMQKQERNPMNCIIKYC